MDADTNERYLCSCPCEESCIMNEEVAAKLYAEKSPSKQKAVLDFLSSCAPPPVMLMDHGRAVYYYRKYLDATKNGIPWPEDNKRVIITEPCDPESGSMESFKIIIDRQWTRCIRIIGVEDDWKAQALLKVAEGKALSRKVDRILHGRDSKKRRVVDFRFCKVGDAILFKSEMEKNNEFPECTIAFTNDPCAVATGVHTGAK